MNTSADWHSQNGTKAQFSHWVLRLHSSALHSPRRPRTGTGRVNTCMATAQYQPTALAVTLTDQLAQLRMANWAIVWSDTEGKKTVMSYKMEHEQYEVILKARKELWVTRWSMSNMKWYWRQEKSYELQDGAPRMTPGVEKNQHLAKSRGT
jgi:hypothetical protein